MSITLTNAGIYNFQEVLDGKSTFKYDLLSILNSLSKQCRYNGNLPTFYSVAHHSYLVSKLFTKDPLISLHCLIHDFHEAFTGDITQPIQKFIGNEKLKLLQKAIDKDILNYFEIPELSALDQLIVGKCDRLAFLIEFHEMFSVKDLQNTFIVEELNGIPEYKSFIKNENRYSDLFYKGMNTTIFDLADRFNNLRKEIA